MHKKEHPLNQNKVIIVAKFGRAKNPCKICFQSVSKRKGIQCQGACKKWVHFTCLEYTPGKIQDIKAGLITIVCPCPDCSTEPKEIFKDPLTCPEPSPSNKYPKGDVANCAKNSMTSTFSSSQPCECVNPTLLVTRPNSSDSVRKEESCETPTKGTTGKTVQKSKSCSCRLDSSRSDCLPPPPNKPITCKKSVSCETMLKQNACKPVFRPAPCTPVKYDSFSPTTSVELQSPCESSNDNVSMSMVNVLEQMCKTVTDLSEQIKIVMCKLAMK